MVRLCSTNYQGFTGIGIRTNLAGNPEFYMPSSTLVSAQSIQMSFTLSGVNLFFGALGGFVAQMPGYTDMGTLFDNYMIEKVEIMAMASWNGNTVTGGSTVGQLPYIVHCFDIDDTNESPSTVIMQKTGAKFTQLISSNGTPNKLATIKPAQASMIYNTSTTTAYAPKRGFVDMANPNVPHYGYKMALDNSSKAYPTSTDIGTLNLVFRYHIKLRFTL